MTTTVTQYKSQSCLTEIYTYQFIQDILRRISTYFKMKYLARKNHTTLKIVLNKKKILSKFKNIQIVYISYTQMKF